MDQSRIPNQGDDGEPNKARQPYRMPTKRMRLRPGVDLTKALELAAALEDDEIIRKRERDR